MVPYMTEYIKYVDLFVPRLDSTYGPAQIITDSVRLPRYYEEPLVLYFSGYGYLPSSTSTTIQVLDSLSFNYWRITSATPATWEGAKKFPNDTLVTLGLPPAAGQLLLLYSSNKPITIDPSAPLRLQDSKDTSNVFFEIDDTAPTKVTQLLTKAVYSYDTYYSSLKIRSSLASTIVLPTTEKILYYLAHDTVKSIASYPIRAISPTIGNVSLNTITATSGDTIVSGRRGFKNVETGVHRLTFGADSVFMFDYYIRDTATTSLFTFPTKKTFSITTPSVDTPSYVLLIEKLLYNGSIQTDTILISTRDTVRDLIRFPLP
ncbi:hypothetical protein FACS1894181_08270 [Bacteroidia bacterium]|nr:hypothetical protein FACS1894181_08270 [Bacteroidia bacterium]